MKLSNFILTKTEGTRALDKTFMATVDVETGVFWRRKIQNRIIFRAYAGLWHFVDTGEYCQAEALARSWTARTGQET